MIEPKAIIKIFSALSTENRLKLFRCVATAPHPLNVGMIAKIVDMKDSLASQNLRILEESGLLDGFPGGTYKLYTLNHETWQGVVEFLNDMKGLNDDGLARTST